MRRGKRGRGMVNAKRSRMRERKTIDSILAIANEEFNECASG